MHTGSCLCGSVTFKIEGDLAVPDACHCTQCRKQSGHFWVSTEVLKTNLTLEGEDNLTWYQASERVRRGFCARCGSFLFWDPIFKEKIGIAMGAFDTPTQTQLGLHIFVADKGDYYEITDGLPQNQQ
jgi:hypothetical protein